MVTSELIERPKRAEKDHYSGHWEKGTIKKNLQIHPVLPIKLQNHIEILIKGLSGKTEGKRKKKEKRTPAYYFSSDIKRTTPLATKKEKGYHGIKTTLLKYDDRDAALLPLSLNPNNNKPTSHDHDIFPQHSHR